MEVGNLFEGAMPPPRGELIETLLSHHRLVIERIVSSPVIMAGEYVQAQDEWVVLLAGDATLRVSGEEVTLTSGSHIFLPAGAPHSVERVSNGAIWLAVHLMPG